MLQSSDYTVTWNNGLVTTKNAAIGPDGTLSANRVAFPVSAATQWYCQQGVAATAAQYTFSIHAKAGTTRFCNVKIQQNGTAHYGIYVDLETGAVTKINSTAGGTKSYKIESLSNGWWHIAVTCPGDVMCYPTFSPCVTGTDVTTQYGDVYAATNGEYCYFANAQFEPGATLPPTSRQRRRR